MLNPSSDSKIFYGWYVVAVAFAANFLSVGTGFYILNAFMDPLCHANGWSRTDLNMALSVSMLFGYLVQFVYGTIVAKAGPRMLMVIAPFFSGLMFMMIGRVTVLWQFYIVFILLYLGNNAYGGIVANTAVSNWFILKRGQAMGVAAAAISFSGSVVPPIAMLLLVQVGMKTTTLLIGFSIMLLGPAAWFIVKDWPETYGLLPDGVCCLGTKAQVPEEEEVLEASDLLPDQFPDFEGALWGFKDLMRTPAFWKMGFAYVLTLTGVMGVMSQLQPRFVDEGYTAMKAMGLMAITAIYWGGGKIRVGRTVRSLRAPPGDRPAYVRCRYRLGAFPGQGLHFGYVWIHGAFWFLHGWGNVHLPHSDRLPFWPPFFCQRPKIYDVVFDPAAYRPHCSRAQLRPDRVL